MGQRQGFCTGSSVWPRLLLVIFSRSQLDFAITLRQMAISCGGVLFSLPGVNLEGITDLVVVVWVGPYVNNPSIYSFCDFASLFLLI